MLYHMVLNNINHNSSRGWEGTNWRCKKKRNGNNNKKKRGTEKQQLPVLGYQRAANTPASIDSHQERRCTLLYWLPTDRPTIQGQKKKSQLVRKRQWDAVHKALLDQPTGHNWQRRPVTESRYNKTKKQRQEAHEQTNSNHITDRVGFEGLQKHQKQTAGAVSSVCSDRSVLRFNVKGRANNEFCILGYFSPEIKSFIFVKLIVSTWCIKRLMFEVNNQCLIEHFIS